MGPSTAGARLGYTGKEAATKGAELLDNFFKGFTKVKQAIDDSKAFLRKNGYVEDFVGRRRRLSDINLDPYSVEYFDVEQVAANNFNPILGCKNRVNASDAIQTWERIIACYVILSNTYQLTKNSSFEGDKGMSNQTFQRIQKLAQNYDYWATKPCDTPGKYNNRRTYEQKLLDDMKVAANVINYGIYKNTSIPNSEYLNTLITDYKNKYGNAVPTSVPKEKIKLMAWTGRIAQAERRCFNARIQGSAASLTKMAMVDIFKDERLKKYNAKLIITVHDEVLVECPEVYAAEVEKILPEIMIAAAKKAGDNVPQDCDPYNVTRWYADVEAASVLEAYKKAIKSGLAKDKALEKVYKQYSEFPQAAIDKVISGETDELIF